MHPPPPPPIPHRLVEPISCSRCEACCCRLQVILMPGDAPPPWLTEIEAHGLEVMRQGDDGWCIALDRNTLRCTIYEQRPALCREYAEGGFECRQERRESGLFPQDPPEPEDVDQ